MPWKPPAVGGKRSPYDARWQRIRNATLQAEPLCRLCRAAGRTVPATIVDHIKPLAEGGTHAAENLQPLCKRCHDAVKTPSDVAARARADAVALRIVAVAFGVTMAGSGVVDQRELRRVFAAGMGWQSAHVLSLAAMDGIVAAAMRGDLPRLTAVIVTDDARWARAAAVMLGTGAAVQPLADNVANGERGSEAAWLYERYGLEREARMPEVHGRQSPRAC
jgi:hypothetical protein